jgi:hypothetical protein
VDIGADQYLTRTLALASDASMTAWVGQVVTYTLVVTNTGLTGPEHSIVEAVSPREWEVTVTPPEFELEIGATQTLQVEVMVPGGAVTGTVDGAEVSVYMGRSPGVRDLVTLSTRALAHNVFLPLVQREG